MYVALKRISELSFFFHKIWKTYLEGYTSALGVEYPDSMDWVKTTARQNEKHLSFGVWCAYTWGYTVYDIPTVCNSISAGPSRKVSLLCHTVHNIVKMNSIPHSAGFYVIIWWYSDGYSAMDSLVYIIPAHGGVSSCFTHQGYPECYNTMEKAVSY